MAQQKRIQLGTMRLRVRSLASFRELRIWCGCGCGCGWQLYSNLTLSLGTSICCRCGPKRQKKKKGKSDPGRADHWTPKIAKALDLSTWHLTLDFIKRTETNPLSHRKYPCLQSHVLEGLLKFCLFGYLTTSCSPHSPLAMIP